VNQSGRNNSILNNELIGIDIFQKNIECLNSLLDATLDVRPLLFGNNARNNIKRKDLFDAFPIAVNSKCDTLT
jgi:hypothetical protein